MASVRLVWKQFNVNLPAVESRMKADYPTYQGNSADSALTLWFSEEPTEEQSVAIRAYWDGITEESVETTSYRSHAVIMAQIALLKAGLILKNWDAMTATERKLMMGMAVTTAELFGE
jgi:hypothetical protein